MSGSTLTLAQDAHSGRTLGKYEILCRLSTGGMSVIFLAFQRGLAGFRKIVVLKQILPDIQGEEEFVRMFLDEAKITAAFNHPNIAQVFDLDIDDGELFLAMEFVPGATLVEVARACRSANEPIPIGFTLMSVRDTALALHYAHTFTDPLGRPQQIIHRDIAEKNIMVTYEGVTKLLDFGIAKALNRASRTSVGMVKGTSGYMSPEQILGEPLDPRSDIFSLGVVFHECLTGMRLFHGKSPEDGMMQALKGQVAPPSAKNPKVSREIDAVVLKALSRERHGRYGTALELARAIEKVAGGEIWHPEQSGPLMQRLFGDRRDQTRQLLSSSREQTGNIRFADLLNKSERALPRAESKPPAPKPGPRDVLPTSPKVASPLTAMPPRRTGARPAVPAKPPPPEPPQPQRARSSFAEPETASTGEQTVAMNLDDLLKQTGGVANPEPRTVQLARGSSVAPPAPEPDLDIQVESTSGESRLGEGREEITAKTRAPGNQADHVPKGKLVGRRIKDHFLNDDEQFDSDDDALDTSTEHASTPKQRMLWLAVGAALLGAGALYAFNSSIRAAPKPGTVHPAPAAKGVVVPAAAKPPQKPSD